MLLVNVRPFDVYVTADPIVEEFSEESVVDEDEIASIENLYIEVLSLLTGDVTGDIDVVTLLELLLFNIVEVMFCVSFVAMVTSSWRFSFELI